MKSYYVVRSAQPRPPMTGLLKASFLALLLALAWSQDLLPCDAGTQSLTVANTNDAIDLAKSLDCSNGTFAVEWFGEVIVTETITITEGTLVNITGATTDATADGDGITQLFALYGASSALHIMDMTLTNGLADEGGAVYATEQATVSFGGSMTFSNNHALFNGGAVIARASSAVSWGGDVIFQNNTVQYWGGAMYVTNDSTVSWTGTTKLLHNTARDGGGIFLFDGSIGSWSGNTTFEGNTATFTGGGLNVHTGSQAFWTGETTFTGNIANGGGAMFVWGADVSWTGITVFADNIADLDGGAVYTPIESNIYYRGTTTFRNNTATTGNGGALSIDASSATVGSNVNISNNTLFVDNVAFLIGGAIFSSAVAGGQHFEGVTFRSNSAAIGGAIAIMGNGDANDITASPTMVSRCQFISNTASISSIAVAGFGPVEINSCYFNDNVLFCEAGLVVEEVPNDNPGTTRYETVCGGCPSWDECVNCTVENSDHDPVCSILPDHAYSDQPGTTLETLLILPGYWRSTISSATILACYNQDACLGGQTETEAFCDSGYTGPYCSVCEGEYFPSLSHTCARCSESRRQWFVAIAAIAGFALSSAIAVILVYLVSTNFEQQKSTRILHQIGQAVPVQAFKGVIVVWQILTQFASVANVTYPGVYQTFMNSLDIINLDIGFVVSAGCLWPGIDFHDRLLAGTIWPLVVLGLLALAYAIALHRNSGCDDSTRQQIRQKHLSAVLFLMFFVYSSVSATVFRMFACDSLDDGEEYLRADYRILCTNEKHRVLQVYAGFMIAIYPVGIPLLFGVLLCRHREVLSDSKKDKTAAKSISSLWAPYRHNRFYYEIVECGRRIVLTGAVVFIYPNDTAQIAITIINTFLFFVVFEVLSPYTSASDAWVTRLGHVLIFFSMFDVLLLRVDVSQESSESQKVLAGVLVVGHVVMIVAVVAEAYTLVVKARPDRLVVEERTPSRRVLRTSTIVFRQERAESDHEFQGRNVLVS